MNDEKQASTAGNAESENREVPLIAAIGAQPPSGNGCMRKYRAEVTRISYARQTVEIDEASIGLAKDRALKKASEGAFSTYESEYEISWIEPVVAERPSLTASIEL